MVAKTVKNWNQKPVEPIGILPRSILRTFNRFIIQLFPNSNHLILQEFRISRYQVFVSIQCLISLIFIPFIITSTAKIFVFIPLTEYVWNTQTEDIFLNAYLEKEALAELQDFEEQLYFDFFLSPTQYDAIPPSWASDTSIGTGLEVEGTPLMAQAPRPTVLVKPSFDRPLTVFNSSLKTRSQEKTLELARHYNQKSIESLTNLFSDILNIGTFAFLVVILEPQIIILKSFLIESIYSLSDTIKSFLLILGTDLLVGFHSPRGWELFLEFVLNRVGFPHDENFIFLFVATLPVLLDTVFKYWIFRYLNKISPSTVATYHAMIE